MVMIINHHLLILDHFAYVKIFRSSRDWRKGGAEDEAAGKQAPQEVSRLPHPIMGPNPNPASGAWGPGPWAWEWPRPGLRLTWRQRGGRMGGWAGGSVEAAWAGFWG